MASNVTTPTSHFNIPRMTPSASSSSADDSESDEWASDSQSPSSSIDDFDDDAFTSSEAPKPSRFRPGRKATIAEANDLSARAYGDALRSVRMSSHRASISVASPGFSGGPPLSEDTRRRHRDSKRRMECADLTQRLFFRVYELDQFIQTAPLWLHARIIPPRWRVQIMTHLTPIHEQTIFCRDRVVAAWHLLLPPFDRANLHEYEKRLALFERSVVLLDTAIQQCQEHVTHGEQTSACTFIQYWYRQCLARRGYYTKVLHVNSRQSRGLIPGLFDTIAAMSRLTIHPGTPHRMTLEYPKTPGNAKHAFSSQTQTKCKKI